MAIAAATATWALWMPRWTTGALRHWDEAWYAQTSFEMLQTGSWLTPRWNGELFFDKPPLSFWATAICFRLFGAAEWSARFFSVVCGVAAASLTAVFAARSAAAAGRRAPYALGLAAALLLACIPEFSRYATRGQTDSPLTFFLVVQVAAFWLARRDFRWRVVEGISFGLALMTKGSAAFLAPAVLVIFLVAAGRFRRSFTGRWWLAWIIGLGIAAPWHLHQYAVHGDRFLTEYGNKHFGRFFYDVGPAVQSGPPPKPTYYFDFLARKQPFWGWPFLVLAAVAVVEVGRAAFRLRQPRHQVPGCGPDPDLWLLLTGCWLAAVPLMLSVSRTKWHWYLMPAYPAAALFAVAWVQRFPFCDRRPGLLTACTAGLAFLGSIEGWITPANVHYEPQIRRLAESVRERIHPSDTVRSLQMPTVRESVYPIACVFYSRRPVHNVRGLEQLDHLAAQAATDFYLFAHVDAISAARSRLRDSGGDIGWEADAISIDEPIGFFRIRPRSGPSGHTGAIAANRSHLPRTAGLHFAVVEAAMLSEAPGRSRTSRPRTLLRGPTSE